MMKITRPLVCFLTGLLLLALAGPAGAVTTLGGGQGADGLRGRYAKREVRIPMRDGVQLFTAIYTPKDASQKYPFLFFRTPYGIAPYGEDAFPNSFGPSRQLEEEGFIFVRQDVRGKFMSEGEFVNVRPQLPPGAGPRGAPSGSDESTDVYDTIEWLLKNVPNHNGRVGQWGISYPGFYTALGMVNSHPALKAASPQAPVSDWFIGDDFHHHGAFFLFDAFNFFALNGRPRPQPTSDPRRPFAYGTPDAYRFFLDMGPLRNANEKHLHGEIAFWNDLMAHPDYDAWWRARSVPPQLKNVRAAVLNVGGWFDAEDLYGPLHVYGATERQNPGITNTLVMGPWSHGGWGGNGSALGDVRFGSDTAATYREELITPFFNAHLKGKGTFNAPEARVFETGANRWLSFDRWPPPDARSRSLYLQAGGGLSFTAPAGEPGGKGAGERGSRGEGGPGGGFDQYVSDPAKPVPYTDTISMNRGITYMIEDQRFAARRPDVLVYQTEPLARDLALAGPVRASLFVATTGTDADFVVKVVDVYPDDAPETTARGSGAMGGFQMLVRGEVMRAKYRGSFERPEPLRPGRVTPVEFELPDVCHTFRKGHRLMVQVQSSWFPLVDRNPQTFVNIYQAREADFRKAEHRIYHTAEYPSRIVVGVRGE